MTRAHRCHSLSGLGRCGRCRGKMHILTPRDEKPRIYCYQRRQVGSCNQPSVHLNGIEAQIEAYLGTFVLPQEAVDRIVALHDRHSSDRTDAMARRSETESRLDRLRKLYEWGDIADDEYKTERGRLEADLAATPAPIEMADLIVRAAELLRDLPSAWASATPKQRNDLARVILQSVEIDGDRVVAVVPQPEFSPFFVDRSRSEPNTDDDTSSGSGGVNHEIEEAEATGVGAAC